LPDSVWAQQATLVENEYHPPRCPAFWHSGVLALRIRHVALAQILKNKQLAVRGSVVLSSLATVAHNIQCVYTSISWPKAAAQTNPATKKPTNTVDSSKSNKTLGVD